MPESKRDLLKFFGPTEYSLSNLAGGVLYCQHYSAYNDPLEFWTDIYEGVPDALRELNALRRRSGRGAWKAVHLRTRM